jgi:hypothetical protein
VKTDVPGMIDAPETVPRMERIRIEQHSFMGSVWVGGWLFTIGFLHLTFWQGVVAIVIWPYYLGATFSSLVH